MNTPVTTVLQNPTASDDKFLQADYLVLDMDKVQAIDFEDLDRVDVYMGSEKPIRVSVKAGRYLWGWWERRKENKNREIRDRTDLILQALVDRETVDPVPHTCVFCAQFFLTELKRGVSLDSNSVGISTGCLHMFWGLCTGGYEGLPDSRHEDFSLEQFKANICKGLTCHAFIIFPKGEVAAPEKDIP